MTPPLLLLALTIATAIGLALGLLLGRGNAKLAARGVDRHMREACERAFRQGANWQCMNDRRRIRTVIRVAGERGAAVERARREMGVARWN